MYIVCAPVSLLIPFNACISRTYSHVCKKIQCTDKRTPNCTRRSATCQRKLSNKLLTLLRMVTSSLFLFFRAGFSIMILILCCQVVCDLSFLLGRFIYVFQFSYVGELKLSGIQPAAFSVRYYFSSFLSYDF